MKIGVITGSVRTNNQSRRIGEVIIEDLKARHADHEVVGLFLDELNIPLWDEGKWGDDEKWPRIWGPVSEELSSCDAFVIVCPEWAGMATPHLKNLFLCCDNRELAHKPCQMVCISAGMNGAYPVSELRMSGYKNTFLNWLPDHIIIRRCGEFMNGSEQDKHQIGLMTRLQYALDLTVAYAGAMKPIRETMVNHKDYVNGM